MQRFEIIQKDDRLALAWLEAFKQYASVPDDSRDALLTRLLSAAILRVQEYADRALIECRVRQTSTTDEKGRIWLFLGGGKDLSATYDYGGEEAACVQNTADFVTGFVRDTVVTVEFTTEPLAAWCDQARPTVFRYATALYDGEPVEVLNSILNEVL